MTMVVFPPPQAKKIHLSTMFRPNATCPRSEFRKPPPNKKRKSKKTPPKASPSDQTKILRILSELFGLHCVRITHGFALGPNARSNTKHLISGGHMVYTYWYNHSFGDSLPVAPYGVGQGSLNGKRVKKQEVF